VITCSFQLFRHAVCGRIHTVNSDPQQFLLLLPVHYTWTERWNQSMLTVSTGA